MRAPKKDTTAGTSLTQKAYNQFKLALFSGEIESGANYSQNEICEILGQSISPVREALKLLQHDGFIEVLPRSGIHIIKPDLTLFRNCHQMRVILELSAIANYVDTVSDNDLAALYELQADHLEKTQQKVPLTVLRATQIELEQRLHFGIIDSLRNDIITANYRICLEKLNLLRIDRGGFTHTQMIQTANEHLSIIRAARDRDTEAAKQALEEHLRNALHRAMGAVS